MRTGNFLIRNRLRNNQRRVADSPEFRHISYLRQTRDKGKPVPGRVRNMHTRSSRSAGSINRPIRRVITSATVYRRRSSGHSSLSFSPVLLFLRFPSADYLRAAGLLIELAGRLRFRLLQIAERADRNRRVLPIADRKRPPLGRESSSRLDRGLTSRARNRSRAICIGQEQVAS